MAFSDYVVNVQPGLSSMEDPHNKPSILHLHKGRPGLSSPPLEEMHMPEAIPPRACFGSYDAHRVALDGFTES